MKYKKEIKSLGHSFKYAGEGIWVSFKKERNMKIHVFMMALVILFGFLLHINLREWIICIILFGLVIGAELFNTAIETVVDMFTREKNELAGKAKDISAGAVLILAIASAIVGGIIFIPKIIELIK